MDDEWLVKRKMSTNDDLSGAAVDSGLVIDPGFLLGSPEESNALKAEASGTHSIRKIGAPWLKTCQSYAPSNDVFYGTSI